MGIAFKTAVKEMLLNAIFGEKVVEVRYMPIIPMKFPLKDSDRGIPEATDLVTFKAVQRVVARPLIGKAVVLKTGWEISFDDSLRQSNLRINYIWGLPLTKAVLQFYQYEEMGLKANAR